MRHLIINCGPTYAFAKKDTPTHTRTDGFAKIEEIKRKIKYFSYFRKHKSHANEYITK